MIMKTACLKFHCIDRPGIVAAISSFLFERNINIIHLEQHSEEGMYFNRIEWEDLDNWTNKNAFRADFEPIRKKFEGTIDIHFFKETQKLGLFVSNEPHTLLEILAKVEMEEFGNTEIPFIISNYQDDTIAKRHNIPFFYIPSKNNPNYEAQQIEVIQKFNPDFIGLARYMKILTEKFIDEANCPIVNIHHSFLPSFVGAKPYELAYERGVKCIGATSHFVIPALDEGPIIEQDITRVRSGYSADKMKQIGRDTEKRVFAYALKKVLEHKTIIHKNRTVIFE